MTKFLKFGIKLLRRGVGRNPEINEELLFCCKWIGQFICTANDGGNAWCAVREQPGAKEWSRRLEKVLIATGQQPKGWERIHETISSDN